ncbi:ketoacyl-ACP synthase III [Maribacter polysiphoniae]|uniref:3-oxoacyl-[acyl-carrier-protein] synthase-3 n=1 Tax=Maribacter polysiphoniae TaxID=429344 RepID=A0A316EDR5_9FLAO|nr:ketoacyl-ACP synthase III [Maribacter polysiphoniae]MBD1262696.1 ketoacyl-ACP synthase III [Maribacter polysiphoniae]PWK21100.1 3-oxoacyl-[acyl-carrier-protein] synthase-3 [Maribacter polysiphoniae]
MNLKFHNKKITGILTVLPENEVNFDDEIDNYDFSRGQSMKLKLIMGYGKRRVVKEGTTVSDLCIYGLNYLFDNNLLKKEDVDAMVLVTQSPDHFVPATSHIIQGKLDLKRDMICLDINQACSGYPVGLNQAFMLLEQDEVNKVVVLNADIMSRKVSVKDRGSRPITGDAAAITIVENNPSNNVIYGTVNVDGKGAESLIIPAGGFKMPSTPETAELKTDKSGNSRSLDHLVMKGDDIFTFVQKEVPPMIENLLDKASKNKDEVDYYMFHQPNKFMLKKLADKMGVPYTKMPNNIVENFGNASGVSIPTTITYNLGEKLLTNSYLICLAGFGAGLGWASFLLEMGNLDFCETIDYDN